MKANLKNKVRVGDILTTNKKGRSFLGVDSAEVLAVITKDTVDEFGESEVEGDHLPLFVVKVKAIDYPERTPKMSHRFFADRIKIRMVKS